METDTQRVREIAELQARQYFDNYLRAVFPRQVEAMKQYTYDSIQVHDGDRKAHGGVEGKFNRLMWTLFGFAVTAGGGVGALLQAIFGG